MTEPRDRTTRSYAMLDEAVAEGKGARKYGPAMIVSMLVHGLLIFLLIWRQVTLPEIDDAAGPEGDGGVAGGGGGDEVVAIMEMPPAITAPEVVVEPVVPEPTPVVEPDPVVPDIPIDSVPKPPAPSPAPSTPIAAAGGDTGGGSAGTGGGTGGGSGTGTGTGNGSGVGPGDGTGTGGGGNSSITAPSPRGLTLPPSDRPGKVKGKTVTVYVFVTDRGRVVSDSTRLDRSSGDSKYDKRIKEQASEWQFKPGMRAGIAIATWFQYTLTL